MGDKLHPDVCEMRTALVSDAGVSQSWTSKINKIGGYLFRENADMDVIPPKPGWKRLVPVTLDRRLQNSSGWTWANQTIASLPSRPRFDVGQRFCVSPVYFRVDERILVHGPTRGNYPSTEVGMVGSSAGMARRVGRRMWQLLGSWVYISNWRCRY